MPKERAELVLKILNKIDKVCSESGYGNVEIHIGNKTVRKIDYMVSDKTDFEITKQ